MFVINWDDSSFEADFKVMTYAKHNHLEGDVTPQAGGNQDDADPTPDAEPSEDDEEPIPEEDSDDDGEPDNIDDAIAMGLPTTTTSTHRKGVAYGWFDLNTEIGHIKVEKNRDNKNLWFKFDFFTHNADIPWMETETNIPEWYYNMKGFYITEGTHQFYRFKVKCPSGINPCFFSVPGVSYWGDVWLGRKNKQ